MAKCEKKTEGIITRWLSPGGMFESGAGRVSNHDWLRREQKRFAKDLQIKTEIEGKINTEGYLQERLRVV
jgi:hypothetical protein